MPDHRKIWVIAGRDGYTAGDETYELLTEANILAQQSESVISVFLLGSDLDQSVRDLERCGLSDYIYVFESPQLKSYNPYIYLQVFQSMYQEQQAFLILIAGTSMGKDLAPRLAYHLRGEFISNVQQIKSNTSKGLEVVKPIYGGKVHANFQFTGSPPWIATMIPGVVGKEKAKGSRKVEVVQKTILGIDEITQQRLVHYKVIDFVKADPETMDISEADLIVAGGRGANGEKGFQVLKQFAKQIGAVVGCTRPIVDENILPLEKQIGQTGKTVCPNLYISCGISGALQHEMGMKDSKYIIAINVDPQSQVFRIADLKIIADVGGLLPVLIGMIEEYKNKKMA